MESRTPVNVADTCTLLNTADYCLTTTTQLEDRIKAKVDEPLREQVTFDTARESFITAANSAIKNLVRKVESEADLSFREMVNTNWANMEVVGDHSGYVGEMIRGIKDAVMEITGTGHLRERYIRSLCDRVVEWFGGRFIDAIIASRPICEAGAEQVCRGMFERLMVDAPGCLYPKTGTVGAACTAYGSARSTIRSVCSHTPLKNWRANGRYVKFMNKTIAKIETILKVILTAKDPPAGVVQNYFFLIADKSVTNFLKVLELKVRSRPSSF